MPKVPPPSSEKDKTITRRTVKGAAGGQLGVDYEDDRRPDPSMMPGTAVASSRAAKLVREVRAVEGVEAIRDTPDKYKGAGMVREDFVPLEEDAPEETLKKRLKKGHVARDRMSVDKDAPELLRARKWTEGEDEEEEEPEAHEDLEVSDEAGDLIERIPLPRGESRAHLFAEDTRPEPGDLSLTDPDEIARVLGTPVAYAKHAMILAEAFRRTTGATRGEAIEYLSRLFIAPSDRDFGRLAIKEFGPSSGIIDIYPLEVVEHVLERYPGFLPKMGFGRIFAKVEELEDETIFTDVRTPVILEYPPDLKIRAFAVSGGGRPGYLFEPDIDPGKYRLHIYSSGKYRVLISGMNQNGYTTIDRLRIQVRPRKVEDLGMVQDSEIYPSRSEELVAAWPVPEVEHIAEDLSAADEAVIEEAVAEIVTGEVTAPTFLDEVTQPIALGEDEDDEDL